VTQAVLELAALAEEELGLLAAGRTGALAELQERRSVALAALPEQLSADERKALSEVYLLQEQVAALLERAMAATAVELNRINRGQTALRGYADSLKRA